MNHREREVTEFDRYRKYSRGFDETYVLQDNQRSMAASNMGVLRVRANGPSVSVPGYVVRNAMSFYDTTDITRKGVRMFLNKVRAPSRINNVYYDSKFYIRISNLVYVTDYGVETLGMDEPMLYSVRLKDVQSERKLDTTDQNYQAYMQTMIGEAMEVSLFDERAYLLYNKKKLLKDDVGHYITTAEMVDQIMSYLHELVSVVGAYILVPEGTVQPSVYDVFTRQELLIYYVFKCSELQFDSYTGKLALVTKNKNLRNDFEMTGLRYASETETNLNAILYYVFYPGELRLSNFYVDIFVEADYNGGTDIYKRTARQLGLDTKLFAYVTPQDAYSYFVTYNFVYWFSFESSAITEVISLYNMYNSNEELYNSLPYSLQTYLDSSSLFISSDSLTSKILFPLPSNMFYTTYFEIHMGISVNCFYWGYNKPLEYDGTVAEYFRIQPKPSETKVSKNVLTFYFEKSGQETHTQEMKTENRVEFKIDPYALNNITLGFLDEFGKEITFDYEVEIDVVLMF